MKFKEAIKSSKYNRAINLVHKDKSILLRYRRNNKDDLKTIKYSKDDKDIIIIKISKWKLNRCNSWVPDDIDIFPEYLPKEQHYRHILAQYKRLMKDN